MPHWQWGGCAPAHPRSSSIKRAGPCSLVLYQHAHQGALHDGRQQLGSGGGPWAVPQGPANQEVHVVCQLRLRIKVRQAAQAAERGAHQRGQQWPCSSGSVAPRWCQTGACLSEAMACHLVTPSDCLTRVTRGRTTVRSACTPPPWCHVPCMAWWHARQAVLAIPALQSLQQALRHAMTHAHATHGAGCMHGTGGPRGVDPAHPAIPGRPGPSQRS